MSKGGIGRKERIPGKLIAVEGLDGSGKSTQVALLRRWFELENYKVFFTEWNSSTVVKKVTKKGKDDRTLTPTTFSLIHATDFADRYERQILPLLRAGYIVLADRYVFTAFARDAVRGIDRSYLRRLYDFAVLPDITLFFNVPLQTALDRILSGRPELKYHEAGLDLGLSEDPYESFRIFQGRVYEEYKRMWKEFDFDLVDATRAPEEQQRWLRQLIGSRIELSKFKQPRVEIGQGSSAATQGVSLVQPGSDE
jgi:dTMP kinase